MMRIITVLLALLLLSGCMGMEDTPQFDFYYPRGSFVQYSEDSVITSEVRENVNASATVDILNLYLKGPLDPMLVNPFPADIRVLSVQVMADTVYVTVSDELAQLNGVSLVLACTSLGKTATAMTGTAAAEIQCEKAMLNGLDAFTVSSDSILYLDEPIRETTAPTGGTE